MKTQRPVNLNLFPQPLAAIVSISHRITGVMLFVGVAFGLYALDMAMASPQGFAQAKAMLSEPFPAFILLGLMFVLMFHLIAGIKHLLLDFHIGDTYAAAHTSAIVVVVLSLVVTGLLGAMIW